MFAGRAKVKVAGPFAIVKPIVRGARPRHRYIPRNLPLHHCERSFACVGFVLPKSVCDAADCAEISIISLSSLSFFIRWVRFAKSANSSRALWADRLPLSVSTSSMRKWLVTWGASITNCVLVTYREIARSQ